MVSRTRRLEERQILIRKGGGPAGDALALEKVGGSMGSERGRSTPGKLAGRATDGFPV